MPEPILNNHDLITKADTANLLSALDGISEQLTHAWDQATANPELHDLERQQFSSITVLGLGGSRFGYQIVDSVYRQQLPVPLLVSSDYTLPGVVNESSLVIIISASGTTEEVVAAAKQLADTNTTVIAITNGGTVLELAQENAWLTVSLDTKFNRSQESRMGWGYVVSSILAILYTIGVIDIPAEQIHQSAQFISNLAVRCGASTSVDQNPAKTLAYQLMDKHIQLFAAEHAMGGLHIGRNQLHENGKNMADYYQVPEVNHHLLEAVQFPKANKTDKVGIFFQSQLYHPQNQKRLQVMQTMWEKYHIETLTNHLQAEDRLSQSLEAALLLAYTSVYLALTNEINPGPLPLVKEFKDQL